MKRVIIFLTVLFFGGLLPAGAQDRLVRSDGVELRVVVTEISPGEVRYKRFSNPEGPTYVLPVGEVRYIEYSNGERDEFAPAPETGAEDGPEAGRAVSSASDAAASAPAGDVPQPQPAPQPTSGVHPERRYRPGDYYNEGGVEGVVCAVTEEGLHGLVLSLDELFLPWCLLHKEQLQAVGADSRGDGRKNMEAVARMIGERGLSWSDFPAFEWCRRKGEGWYLPAIDELLTLGLNCNGGSRVRFDREARELFNTAFRKHGGRKPDRSIWYLSSTEVDAGHAWMSHLGLEPPYLAETRKGTKYLVRAVHRF